MWRRWDLHFHTPSSFDYENKSVTNSQIISGLRAANIQVVAITDHHYMDVERIRDLQALAANEMTVLPGIELRSELGGSQSVHYIGIFPEDCDIADIWMKIAGQLDLTPSDIAAKGDDFVYAEFKKTAKLIRTLGGVVSVHAGKKSNSIEGIDHTEKFKLQFKKDLAEESVDLFEVGKAKDISSYKEVVFPNIGFRRPLILCSDNHDITTYSTKAPLWIKGDPSFTTIQQLLSEPDRAFVGLEPPQNFRVRTNPTKYIDRIVIKKNPTASLKEDWFDTDLPINPGLTAIIGNKGSGKTALAESIGLLGNCDLADEFSFLNTSKFKQPKNNKAKHFSATIFWASGHSLTLNLNENINPLAPSSVAYLPQNYLEEICNEVNPSAGSRFDTELKSVIFSHVPSHRQLGAESMDQLIGISATPIHDEIKRLRRNLHEINAKIVRAIEDSSADQQQLTLNLISTKQAELDAHLLAKPALISPPAINAASDPSTMSLREELSALAASRVVEVAKIQQAASRKTILTAQTTAAGRLRHALSSLEATFKTFQTENSADAEILGLEIKDIANLTVDTTALTANAASASQEFSVREAEGASCEATIADIDKQTATKTAELDAPNKAYQAYLVELREWNTKHAAILGDSNTLDTLTYLKVKSQALALLPDEIKNLKATRIVTVKEIYRQIDLLADIYRELYKPIHDFIEHHAKAKHLFQLDFHASIVPTNWENLIFTKVNQGRKGTFCGAEEGKKALQSLIETADFQSADGAAAFTALLLKNFEFDYRTTAKSATKPSEQLKAGVDEVQLMDSIFGLEYLEPRYRLRWSGKDLEELSPGERGTLLLIFYLLIDLRDTPLIIDQPEENLDNETVSQILVPCLGEARDRRQVIIVTHNPNLAVVCDSDQVIYSQIDKVQNNRVEYTSGALENPQTNGLVVRVLEGTRPAFDKRDAKYHLS